MTELDAYQGIVNYDRAAVAHGRREQLVPCAVQPRDLELIDGVRRWRFLTTSQALELWWPETAAQVGRRRLTKLFSAGYLDRFRPVARRGSFPWTYRLGREGHRLLQRTELISASERFEPPEIYDYRYVLHHIHLNAWVMAWRRLLGEQLLSWQGEMQIDPPPRGHRSRASDDISGLQDGRPRPLRPDAVLEVAARDGDVPHTFLVEYDRTRRIDKNFDKFRRYDTFATTWWHNSQFGAADRPPWVLFICQTVEHCDRFVHSADRQVTGCAVPLDGDAGTTLFPGRRRMLFVAEPNMHMGQAIARRLPDAPLGHRARRAGPAGPTIVRLPGGQGDGPLTESDSSTQVA